jgi:DNA-binding NtrC family response regulator
MSVRGLLDPTLIPGRDSGAGIQPHFQEGFQDGPQYGMPPIGENKLDRPSGQASRRGNLVIVMEDQIGLSGPVGSICNYLGLNVEVVASYADLGVILDDRRPLAVVASFESEHQDGGHILKSVALHDRDLPVLMVTGGNAIYLGAAEALCEVLHLTTVTLPQGEATFGEMVEFLARAGQRNRRRRLGPAQEVPMQEIEESFT